MRTESDLYALEPTAEEYEAAEVAALKGADASVLDFTLPDSVPLVDTLDEPALKALISDGEALDFSEEMAEYEKLRVESGAPKSATERSEVYHSLWDHGRRKHLITRACLDNDRQVFEASGLSSDAAVQVVYKSLVTGLSPGGELFRLESPAEREMMARKLRSALA